MFPASKHLHENRLLSRLENSDRALLVSHLEPRPLRYRQRIEPAHRKIRNVYFIEQGIASVVAISGSGRRQSEIGMVGREGVTGLAAILGAQRTPHETHMLVGGRGFCITADRLRSIMSQSRSLSETLHRYSHVFSVQIAQAALANALGSIEERIARWLLMVQDRLGGNEIRVTHEAAALMIGVRRPGVTVGLQRLQEMRLLRTTRGAISLLDRAGLEKCAKGHYGVPEAEFARLIG